MDVKVFSLQHLLLFFHPNDPQAEVIDPAVMGTVNVLRSCAKDLSIKRVVVTSSMVAIAYNGTPLTPHVVFNATWNWYTLSKALAEQEAWRFAKESGIDLVKIHLGFTFGTFLQPNLNLYVKLILNLINTLEVSTANGRYLVAGKVIHLSQVSLKGTLESLKENGLLSF
ncbi:Epimerase domain-containing protein [Citrus sinensis]|nr:Epimerase domain-containing protein [Citrus sinensis]